MALKNNAISFIYATAFHYQLMNNCEELRKDDFRSVRLAISTAMRLPSQIGATFYKKFGIYLRQAYGVIEVGLPFINTKHAGSKPDSVGEPLPGFSVNLVDRDPQGHGRILLKGPGMFDAYLLPFRLAEEILINGWFDTGDMGFLEDNVLAIVGRAKAMINFCGMKIFPAIVEDVLEQHSMVEQVRVFAEQHALFSEIPIAEFVVSEGFASVEEKKIIDDVRAFCYRRLAEYCVPKHFRIVQSLPRTNSGKVIRK